MFDSIIASLSPEAGVKRANARRILRAYQGAEATRLTANKRPKNQAADQELTGPFGADSMRAWSRMLVRDNAWAWSALESIVSETIGCGIGVQSAYENDEGEDVEDINDKRDSIWAEWCEVCDLNGQMSFNEIQTLAFREMVEAGECLIHMVTVPKNFNGIYRRVPLALELIEADRIATDRDNFQHAASGENRIVRGVEINEFGKPVAYWIYPDHPASPYAIHRESIRVDAANVLHLYRKDRIGQTRGVSWYAPVVSWLRDLGVYADNELQASAVSSCFVAAIKTDTPMQGLFGAEGDDTTDADGNRYEQLQPGMILNLNPGESLESANPGRPNSSSEPWIALMLRGIAAGTGTSYEAVSKDFSNTSYSSSRTSKLENRTRYRRWQQHWISRLCQPVWDRFCESAAYAGIESFPTMTELLADRRKASAVEFMPPVWEWVDVSAEQSSSEASIAALQSTYADEIGKRGGSWRRNFYQRAKEERLKQSLGLLTPTDAMSKQAAGTGEQAEAQAAKSMSEAGKPSESGATGELAGLSTMQFNRNRKAIEKVLGELAAGTISETKARVFLSGIGMKQESIDMLIADALDGTVDNLPEATEAT